MQEVLERKASGLGNSAGSRKNTAEEKPGGEIQTEESFSASERVKVMQRGTSVLPYKEKTRQRTDSEPHQVLGDNRIRASGEGEWEATVGEKGDQNTVTMGMPKTKFKNREQSIVLNVSEKLRSRLKNISGIRILRKCYWTWPEQSREPWNQYHRLGISMFEEPLII